MEVLKTSQEIVHEGWLIKSPPTKLWRAVGIECETESARRVRILSSTRLSDGGAWSLFTSALAIARSFLFIYERSHSWTPEHSPNLPWKVRLPIRRRQSWLADRAREKPNLILGWVYARFFFLLFLITFRLSRGSTFRDKRRVYQTFIGILLIGTVNVKLEVKVNNLISNILL